MKSQPLPKRPRAESLPLSRWKRLALFLIAPAVLALAGCKGAPEPYPLQAPGIRPGVSGPPMPPLSSVRREIRTPPAAPQGLRLAFPDEPVGTLRYAGTISTNAAGWLEWRFVNQTVWTEWQLERWDGTNWWRIGRHNEGTNSGTVFIVAEPDVKTESRNYRILRLK